MTGGVASSVSLALLLLVVVLATVPVLSFSSSPIYNVRDFGAVGDARTDDTKAFLEAWTSACADPHSPTFLIPSPGTFLVGQIMFQGQCRSSMHVQISGNVVAPNRFWTTAPEQVWIQFFLIDGLVVDGSGELDGQGTVWWDCFFKGERNYVRRENYCVNRPNLLGFVGVNDLWVRGISLKDSPGKHLTFLGCLRVEVSGVRVNAPTNSPNTDGIFVARSQHVRISSAVISTGDDCIAIWDGSFNVSISRITCGPGHGISIGSLKDNAKVDQVVVSSCMISQTMTGVRVKTWQGASGYARGIRFENISFDSVQTPIVIDQFYCPGGGCANYSEAVQLSNLHFVGLHGSSTQDVGISLACSQSSPCEGIVLEDIDIVCMKSGDGRGGRGGRCKSYCNNAQGRSIGTVVPQVPCLQLQQRP